MAFLGSLGKALGLDSEFGKGLVAGTAKGLDVGFKDQIKRTKDNIDNLVNVSYQGAAEDQKRYNKDLKNNKETIDQIIANVGGDKGASHPRAVDAAQTLIKQYGGLKGALSYSENLLNMSKFSGEHPISILQLGQRTNNNNPLTAMALAKSTVDPVVLPDVGALGKDAAVGIMKLDFFGGGDFAEKEISTRAAALLKARGINIDETEMDLPPALKANIDPLIVGMRANTTEEKARLHIMHNRLNKKDPEFNQKSARILDMIKNINNIEKDMKSPIAGLSDASIKSNFRFLERELTQQHFGTDGLKTNQLGQYIGPNVKTEQLKVLKRHASYYVNKLNQAARMQKVTSAEAGSILTKIQEAVEKNKQVIIGEDGKVYISTESIFNLSGYEGDKAILDVKESKPDMPGKDGDKDKDKNDDNSLLKLGGDISEEGIAKGIAIIKDQQLFKRNRKAFVRSKIGMEYLNELIGVLYLQRTKKNDNYTVQDARTEALLLLGIGRD